MSEQDEGQTSQPGRLQQAFVSSSVSDLCEFERVRRQDLAILSGHSTLNIRRVPAVLKMGSELLPLRDMAKLNGVAL